MEFPNPFGDIAWSVETDDYLPKIDIFLRGNGWTSKQIDIEEIQDSVISDPSVDIAAIPVDFDPVEFDYTVFTQEDVSESQEEIEELVIYGYSSRSFLDSDAEYEKELFASQLGPVLEVKFENAAFDNKLIEEYGRDPWNGLLGMGIEFDADQYEVYNGISGSPVLGEGLVGIHSGMGGFPQEAIQRDPVLEETNRVYFMGSKLLKMSV